MKFSLFVLLFIIPKLICSSEPHISSSKTSDARFSATGINFLAILQLILIGYFTIYFIFSFCCCSSGEKEGLILIIYYLGVIFLFITSVIAYVGVSKLKHNYYSSYSIQSLNEVQNSLDRNYNNIIILCDNLTKYNNYTYSSSKLLTKIVTQYNSSFSTNIYYNQNISNELKLYIKEMDSTQQIILSNIQSFTNLSIQFVNSTQKLINDIKTKCVTSSQQTKFLLEYSIKNEKTKKKIESDSEEYLFDYGIHYSNFIVTSVLFMSLIYGFIYCLDNKCSCVCLYLFPVCSFLILFFGSIGCFNIHSDDYAYLNRICVRYTSTNLNDFEQIIYEATHCFDRSEKVNKIKKVSDLLSVSEIHKNYKNAFHQFEKIKMNHLTLKDQDVTVKRMRNIFNNIMSSVLSVDKQIDYMFNTSESAFNESLAFVEKLKTIKSGYSCSTLIRGCDLCIIAKILLHIGLIIMSFAVCFARDPVSCCCSCCQNESGSYSSHRETSDTSSSSTLHVLLIRAHVHQEIIIN